MSSCLNRLLRENDMNAGPVPARTEELHDKTSGYAIFARWPVFALLITGFLGAAPVAYCLGGHLHLQHPRGSARGHSAHHWPGNGDEYRVRAGHGSRRASAGLRGEAHGRAGGNSGLSKTKLRARKATANSILIEPFLTGSTATPVRALGESSQKAASDPPSSQVEP